MKQKTDQRGTVHEYTYDNAHRLTKHAVTAPGSGVGQIGTVPCFPLTLGANSGDPGQSPVLS